MPSRKSSFKEVSEILAKVDLFTAWINDIKDYALKEAVAGKDWFYFDVTDKGVIPSGWKEGLTREDVINGFYQSSYKLSSREEPTEVYYACKKGEDEMSDVKEVYNRYACTILLMLDNWEIKDDYPW